MRGRRPSPFMSPMVTRVFACACTGVRARVLRSGHVDWKVDMKDLDDFGRALVQANHDNGSWRQKLEYIKNLFHDEKVAANAGYRLLLSLQAASCSVAPALCPRPSLPPSLSRAFSVSLALSLTLYLSLLPDPSPFLSPAPSFNAANPATSHLAIISGRKQKRRGVRGEQPVGGGRKGRALIPTHYRSFLPSSLPSNALSLLSSRSSPPGLSF
jgi:hypothetical protein